MPTLQYLESLDSVRVTRLHVVGAAPQPDSDQVRLARLQVFMEVLLALAVGRAVVVPQSYAFDSVSFLTIADQVLHARGQVAGSRDQPFRLHLFGGVTTFDEAIRAMLARVHDPVRPFHSSAMPELSLLDPSQVAAMDCDLRRLHAALDPEVSEPLKLVRQEFVTQPVTPVPRTGGRALPEALAEIARAEPRPSELADEADVRALIADAVQRLGPTNFAQRSRLRQDRPWPSDLDGRTPLELVGEERLSLVTEFVDSAYNRVVADSIGIAEATFSTDPGTDAGRQRARAVAQHLAVSAIGDEPGLPMVGPLFDVQVRPETFGDAAVRRREVEALHERGAEVLQRLLHLRAQDRQAPFWRSASALEQSLRSGEGTQHALDRHLSLLSRELSGAAGLDASDGRLQLRLGRLGSVGAVAAVAADYLPPAVALGVGGVAALSELADLAAPLQQRLGRRRLTQVLGEVVAPVRVGAR